LKIGVHCMIFRKNGVFLGTVLSLLFFASEANAHWCNDLWQSAYNLVVRPESDTVTVPSSGSAKLNIFVQNNMEYALPSFKLVADIGGTAITATRVSQKVSGALLPGEKAKYELAVSKSGGGTVNATDINFSVSFGNSGQSNGYGDGVSDKAKAAMIKKTDGTLSPASPVPDLGVGPSYTQGAQLLYAAVADFGDTNSGLDKLLTLYCAGRGSWNSGSSAIVKSNCTDTATVCPTSTPSSGAGTKYEYMHLWSAGELAVRKSALGDRSAVLRKRLQCGVNDSNTGFAGFALMMLGYLGEDAEARTFIEGKIAGTGDIATIAKAAILLMGNAADLTKHKADVTTGASSSSIFVKASCAAALGIVEKNDAIVESNLIPLAKWTEPDTSDNGQAIYAAQILNVVAWDRRGWAPGAGDTGSVSFYGETASGRGGGPGTGGVGGAGGIIGAGGKTGTGGVVGPGGSSGNKDGGVKNDSGAVGSGGVQAGGGAGGKGGTSGPSSSVGTGGSTTIIGVGGSSTPPVGGKGGAGGVGPDTSGNLGAGGIEGIGGSTEKIDGSSGSSCNIRGNTHSSPTLFVVALVGMAWIIGRRRRR
jgi:hypothetical protein